MVIRTTAVLPGESPSPRTQHVYESYLGQGKGLYAVN
jgi:hypothetical protein